MPVPGRASYSLWLAYLNFSTHLQINFISNLMKTFKKILKVIGIVLGSILLLLGAMYTFIHFNIESRMHQTYPDFPAESYAIPQDSATLALGKHLSLIRGCTDCHGKNLAGKVMADDPMLGLLSAANLTHGVGGVGGSFTDEDWIKALRHGVNPENQPLLFMPSNETTHMTQKDLVAVIAYLKSIPPVDNQIPANHIGPLGRVLAYFDKLPLLTVEMIDHSQKATPDIDRSVSASYGQYLSASCTGCHGENFKGGEPHVPGSPQVADLTSTGHVPQWTDVQFIQTLRTGKTPEGKELPNQFMPWQMTQHYSDEELKSLYLFLKSQP